MSISTNKLKKLDDQECFNLWVELKSITKVSLHLLNKGIHNQGKRFSDMSIWTACMRYVLENPEIARPYYIADGAIFAVSDDEWYEFLIERAVNVYRTSRSRFMKWIERNNLQKYEHIYAKHYVL